MERIASILLEDAQGRWPLVVNWLAAFRPFRFEHEGRTFDAANLEDGVWVYRTAQPRTSPAPVPVRLERGEARNFVAELAVPPPAPADLEYQGETYQRKGRSDGRCLYWHG